MSYKTKSTYRPPLGSIVLRPGVVDELKALRGEPSVCQICGDPVESGMAECDDCWDREEQAFARRADR